MIILGSDNMTQEESEPCDDCWEDPCQCEDCEKCGELEDECICEEEKK